MRIQEQRRGTAIVETSEGILIVSGSGERFLLPGGAADKGESRLEAAVRELREETGLRATAVLFLFRHLGSVYRNGHRLVRDDHKVYLIRADGQPRARQEISEVNNLETKFISPNQPVSSLINFLLSSKVQAPKRMLLKILNAYLSQSLSLISLTGANDEASNNGSVALTLSDFPLPLPGLRLPGWDTFVVCIPLASLLTTSVTGVKDSFTWGQWDRFHWERWLSTHLGGFTLIL